MISSARTSGSPPLTSADVAVLVPPISTVTQVARTGRRARGDAADHPGRGAGEKQPHRAARGIGGGADAAARLHDLQRRRHAGSGEVGAHAGDVIGDDGLQIGVERGDRGTLVFAKGGVDLGRQRKRDAGMQCGDDLAGADLMRRVDEREEKDDGDRLDPVGGQHGGGAAHIVLVERGDNRAVGGDALAHLLAAGAGGEKHRRLGLEHEIVHAVPHLAGRSRAHP